MSGSNALTIPRDPTVLVNPLAAMDAGVRSAGTLMDVQSKQGEQLVGQALQQATDPTTGVLDTAKAMRIAAGMGPNAAFAMQGFLKTSSELRGAQITQAGKLDDLVTTLSASAISDSSDENMARIRARGVANGMSPSQLAEVDRIAALPEGQRKIEAWKHLSGAMGAGYGLAVGGYGTPTVTQFGGTSAPVVIRPGSPYAPGGMTVGGGVAHTVDPGTYYAPQTNDIWLDANGQPTTDPNKAVRKVPREQPRGTVFGAPPPGSVGGPGGGGSSAAPQPPGAGPAPIPPAPHGTVVIQNGHIVTQPAAPAAPAAPPGGAPGGGPSTYHGPGMGVLPSTPGPQSSLDGGGVQVASANTSFAPGVGAAAPPSPAVAGDVSAILAGINQARATPQGGTQQAFNAIQNGAYATSPAPAAVAPAPPPAARPPAPIAGAITGLPTGTEDLQKRDIEASTAANLAMGDQQKRLIAGSTAMQALNLASTGPGTGVTSRMYAFLQAQSPGSATPQGAMSDTAWRQVLVKNLLRFAQSSSPRASTDQQLSTQIESNPNPEQLAPAIRHILVQDLGVLKRDIAQTQEMPSPGGGAVVKHIGSFSANTAPEAFMWNEYGPDERKAIEKEYEDKGQTKKLHDSLEIAVRRGAIPDPRKAPAAPPAVVTPAAPTPNALVPTN